MRKTIGFKLLLGTLAIVLVVVVACAKATPTPTPTATPTATPTKVAATPTPTPTMAPGVTATPTATATKVTAATPTPTASPTKATTATPTPIKPTGTVRVAVPNTYYLQGSPRFCPSCSLPSRVGILEVMFEAYWGPNHELLAGPQLAQSWTVSPDMTYADVKVTQGVPWQKGYGEVTAEDFAFSFNEANPRQTPDTVHDTAGDIAAFLDRVEVLDTYTARFHFHTFYSPAQIRIFSTFWEAVPVFSKAVADEKGAEAMKDFLVGTGPFEVDRWVLHEGIFVNAVENHWRKTPYVQRLEMIEVLEGSVQRAMLETGEVDISPLDAKDIPAMVEKGFKPQPEGYFGRSTVGFAGNFWETTNIITGKTLERVIHSDWPWVGNPNDSQSMEKAKKVRQAMALTIDREGLAETVLMGVGRPFYMYEISTDDPYWQDRWLLEYNPDKARQLLAEAGYANGFTFQFRSDPASAELELTEAIASTWETELKIKTEITKVAYSTFRPSIIDHTAIPWYCGDGVSTFPPLWPKGLTLSSNSDGGYNCCIESPLIAGIFREMNQSMDTNRLKDLAYQFFDYLYEEQLVVGVVERPTHAYYNPNRIVEWKMRPEGKGTGIINSPEWIRLAP